MKLKWLAQSSIYRNTIDLVAVIDRGNMLDVGQPVNLVMTTQDSASVIQEPTLALPPDSARSLMQALWDAGVRPAENTDRSGEVAALNRHIGFAEHVAKALLSTAGAR